MPTEKDFPCPQKKTFHARGYMSNMSFKKISVEKDSFSIPKKDTIGSYFETINRQNCCFGI